MLYLLHATHPVNATGLHPARHYLGYSPSPSTLLQRLRRHRNGRGSHLTLAMSRIPGQRLLLANVWEGGPAEEKLLKRRKEHSRLCPLCNQDAPIGSVSTPLPRPHSRPFNARYNVPGWMIGGVWHPSNMTQEPGWYPLGLHRENDTW